MSTKTYTVPATFYLDHIGRGCGETGKIIKETKTRVTVELDAEAFKDLLSDADYYWDCRSDMDMCRPAIINSAKRTLDVLSKAGAPNE
jgi:hypothetical protein